METQAVASKKNEKIKTYVVLGLAMVLVVSMYFRFIHAKTAPYKNQDPSLSATAPLAQFNVPRVETEEPQERERREHGIDAYLLATLRDIFSPLEPQSTAVSKAKKPKPPKPPPTFRLKGTIVGGKRPIAIIDDQFVRTGDRISGYKVTWIGKKEVLLDSGDQKITLEILKNE